MPVYGGDKCPFTKAGCSESCKFYLGFDNGSMCKMQPQDYKTQRILEEMKDALRAIQANLVNSKTSDVNTSDFDNDPGF